jgi:hypothetical protein
MKNRIIVILSLICLSLSAKSSDSLNVSFNFVPPDSIPEGYFCLVFASPYKRAKYKFKYNNQIAIIKFHEEGLFRERRKWRRMFGEEHRAYVLIRLDTTTIVTSPLNIEVSKKRKIWFGEKLLFFHVRYYGYFKYLYVGNPKGRKGNVLNGIWLNKVRERYLR